MHGGAYRLVLFGEVLFDCFADGGKVLGGAPFNVAWHLQAFGASPLLISRVGDDALGDDIRGAMRRWGMDCRELQKDAVRPTGSVSISLSGGEPQFDILADQAYDFIEYPSWPLTPPLLLYHGSLALRTPLARSVFGQLAQSAGCRRFFDVNLRRPWWTQAEIDYWMRGAAWVKMNGDELAQLSGQAGVETAMRALLARHAWEGVVVTLGAVGAVALAQSGEWVEVRPAAHTAVVDTVGAGDAFAAVLLYGLQQNWPLATSMERAQAFAAHIVERRGAVVADEHFYQAVCREWRDEALAE